MTAEEVGSWRGAKGNKTVSFSIQDKPPSNNISRKGTVDAHGTDTGCSFKVCFLIPFSQ